MSYRRLVAASAVLTMGLCSCFGRDNFADLVVVPDAQVVGEGPAGIFGLPNGQFVVWDTVNYRALLYDKSGVLAETIEGEDLKNSAIKDFLSSIEARSGTVTWQRPGQAQISPADAANYALVQLMDSRSGAADAVERERPKLNASFTRLGRSSGTLRIETAPSVHQHIKLTAEPGHELAVARALAVLRDGSVLVLLEEVTSRSTKFEVSARVEKWSATGLGAVGYIPLAELPVTPGDYVSATADGTVMYLKTQDAAGGIGKLTLQPAGSVSRLVGSSREIRTDFDFARYEASIEQESAFADVAVSDDSPRKRSEILRSAELFLMQPWTLTATAFVNNAKPIPNDCRKTEGRYWKRSSFFTKEMIGREFHGVPYKWAGYMSPEQFARSVTKDKLLAGNVCACKGDNYNWCKVPEAAGVDCSGFVSQVWGTSYVTTKGFHSVSVPIVWRDLKPGDAMYIPNRHIRLFNGFEDRDGQLLVKVVEASQSCGRVCATLYTPAQLWGYTAIRFKHVVEE